jgi:flagellar hook protein FlgE
VSVEANLRSDADIPTVTPFDPLNAAKTSNFPIGMKVYDSLGKAYDVDIYFEKTGPGAWSFHALTDGGGITGGTKGTPIEIGSGTLNFDAQGRLTAQTQSSNFNPLDAVQPQPLTFNFGTPLGTGTSNGLDGITQYAQDSASSFQNQDGFAAGTLANLQVDKQGNVLGAFTNGQSRVLGQVAVANFQAQDQLESLGGNLFLQSNLSGQPAVGAAGTGGRGDIYGGNLEQSNVDLATEFVRMIAAQRGFQANSKTMQTADQMLSELMTLKR